MAEYTPEEAAARLGLSPLTVRRQAQKGKLPSHHDEQGRLVITLPSAASPDASDASSRASEPRPERVAAASPDAALLGERADRIASLEAELAGVREVLAAVEAHRDALAAEVEEKRRQLEAQQAQAQRQQEADTQAQSELRQLLLQAQLQVQALIPKLPAPGETQESEQRKPWWRWWG